MEDRLWFEDRSWVRTSSMVSFVVYESVDNLWVSLVVGGFVGRGGS